VAHPERAAANSPPTAPPAPDTPAGFTIQIARGPSAAGAKEALRDARRVLGPAAERLVANTERSQDGDRRRYTAVLTGFPTAAAAEEACDKLHAAGHRCFKRAGGAPAEDKAPAPAAPPVTVATASQPASSPAALPPTGFVVQLTYGRSEVGAGDAITRARKALGLEAAKLTATTEKSQVGRHTRYTATLGGFETAAAAVRACETLQKAEQSCFARPASQAATE
jgi:hypothetical protein